VNNCGRFKKIAANLLLSVLIAFSAAQAHEVRPAYLEIKENAPGEFSVIWRTPVLAGMRLPVVLQMPDGIRNLKEPVVQELSDSLVERRWIHSGPNGLLGKRIKFPGLQLTITDVLVRIERLDGAHSTELIRPSRPWVEIAASRGAVDTAVAFLEQGIKHILLGVDHLLFVLGLLLIVRTPWMLVKTITAFTVAHSITLAIATLGYASIPAPPLNAAIALSIVFLGPEIVREWRGQTSFTIRHPWVVAFAFGLLHGFGFASGLAATGLPKTDIPLALLMFNVGIEICQILFVAAVLVVMASLRKLDIHLPLWGKLVPVYAIGSVSAYWFWGRVAAMF
jgi:hydrogenase/urease accessory protein HupE